MDTTTNPHPPAAPGADAGRAPWTWLGRAQAIVLRPETLLLLLGLAWTIGAKYAVVRRLAPDDLAAELVRASWSDVLFFSSVGLVVTAILLIPRPRLAARTTVVVAAIVAAWSVLNAAWLIATRVQLQPGVVVILAGNPGDFLPIVTTHLKQKPAYAIPIVLTGLAGAAWLIWKLVRPSPVRPVRRQLLRAVPAALGLVVSASMLLIADDRGPTAHWREVLGFSSHGYALNSLINPPDPGADVIRVDRSLPRVGQRDVDATGVVEKPNVIVVMLESASRAATSLGSLDRDTTPNLARLAEQGVTFTNTRVPCASTTKAFWTTFTGAAPDVEPDYAEAILVDQPYESLPSILRGLGYRSAFFQVAKGSYECGPGLFRNLGFDWAWFRENLEDPSAHVGYMGGDDFRLIEPMFEWIESGDGPFLLGMITTVSHDPYEIPSWYDHEQANSRYAAHLQAVRFTDDFLGALLERLDAAGLTDRTMVVVIGDHGDGFRKESPRARWIPFEEVIGVPWVIRWPGHLETGRRIDWPASQLDVTPTVLAMLGFDVSRADFDGVNALRPQPAGRRLYFTTPYTNSPYGYVEGDRKYVYWPYTDRLYLYDLADDPRERAPTAVDGPDRAAILADLEQWRQTQRIEIPPRRFREQMIYRHWQTFASGRAAWAYYVGEGDGTSE